MINLLFDLMQLSMGALVTQIRDSNLVYGTRARILQQAQQSSNAIDSAGHGQVRCTSTPALILSSNECMNE